MRPFLLLALLLVCCGAYPSPANDSLFNELKYELSRQAYYDQIKENRINNLRNALNEMERKNNSGQFELCLKLYDEYKSYKYDSAYVYAARLSKISLKMHNPVKENYSKMKLGFILLSAGKYKEAFGIIEKINHKGFGEYALEDYYSVMIRANSDLAGYDNDEVYSPAYNARANIYLDSAIRLSKTGSYSRLFLNSYRDFINVNNRAALDDFSYLNKKFKPAPHEDAITASLIAELYLRMNQTGKATSYLINAVIADTRASTKETLAIYSLAEVASKKGDVENSYVFIQQALKDAQFYGARQRQVQINSVLPFIAAQKLNFIESQKKRFLLYLCSTLFLTLLIILVSFLLYKELQHRKAKEKMIEQSKGKLESMNLELIEVNKQVIKANQRFAEDAHIKEEYIGYFFNIISGYILKLEKVKNAVEARVMQHKIEQIIPLMNEINVHKERETLFQTFDKVFLKIFPNFIVSFNALFRKENQVWPKDHEILTTDLRIFALIRLGIDDTETLSKILQYTAKTIYVYKMRLKAKSIYSSDEFDERLMNIKATDIPVKEDRI